MSSEAFSQFAVPPPCDADDEALVLPFSSFFSFSSFPRTTFFFFPLKVISIFFFFSRSSLSSRYGRAPSPPPLFAGTGISTVLFPFLLFSKRMDGLSSRIFPSRRRIPRAQSPAPLFLGFSFLPINEEIAFSPPMAPLFNPAHIGGSPVMLFSSFACLPTSFPFSRNRRTIYPPGF